MDELHFLLACQNGQIDVVKLANNTFQCPLEKKEEQKYFGPKPEN